MTSSYCNETGNERSSPVNFSFSILLKSANHIAKKINYMMATLTFNGQHIERRNRIVF